MNGISPWAAAASYTFSNNDLPGIYKKINDNFSFEVYCTNDSLWILAEWPKGGRIVFRLAYSSDGGLEIKSKREDAEGIKIFLNALIGDFTVTIKFPQSHETILRYTTTLKPRTNLLVPFWPRDIIIP